MTDGNLHIKLLTGLAALGMAAVTSGCVALTPTEDTTTTLVVGTSRTGPAVREINSVIESRTDLISALDALRRRGVDYPPVALGELLDRIGAENGAPAGGLPSFSGFGGAFTHVLMGAARAKMDSSGDYDPDRNVSVALSGLITGYTFDSTNNRGSLLVETNAVTTVDGVVVESVEYVWDIEIRGPGYEVHTHSGDRDDPFPGTLPFGEDMLNRIESKGYNRKLWAYGPRSIHINSLTETNNLTGDARVVTLPDPLVMVGPDSCIDIMFEVPAGGHIPTNLAELRDPSYSYCLGRCARPPIINSK